MYKNWVGRVATKEFADELILVAVAVELKVRIVVVPFTRADAPKPWVISTYQDATSIIPEDRNIYVGNNDVHYMWISQSLLV